MDLLKIFGPRWEVSCGDFRGGWFENFWTRKGADEYAKRNFSNPNNLYMDLTDNYTGERYRLKDNPEGIAPPVVMFR